MATTQKPHVLVVEDEPDLSTLVDLNLELAGYRVTTAMNGQAGLDAVAAEQPDVVVLDVMMPVMDGWQVLDTLTRDPELKDIPVIMLTALSEERDLIRGHLQGAVRYVTKPFEMRALLEAITDALKPVDEATKKERNERTRSFLTRLAELDSGRTSNGPPIRLSRLETRRRSQVADDTTDLTEQRALLEGLTPLQRDVLERFGSGHGASRIARDLNVSRSNIYAMRKRIAQKLSVEPDEVAHTAKALLEKDTR